MQRNRHIIIDADLEQRIAAIAEDSQLTPSDVVRIALDAYEVLHPSNGNGQRSAYDTLLNAGLIGCIEGGPADLSTNPKYMEGFGND